MKRRIGIMGGTFDPVHIGHLILGEKAYEQFALDQVLFMPAGNPPHKRHREGRASDDQRRLKWCAELSMEIHILAFLWKK